MEIYDHARISQKRWGGCVDDYFKIHRLIDSTKVLCSDNRHRIFHTIWAVKEVVIPVFGEVYTNSEGRQVDVKALCEKDHLLVDYHHRFIPTLADFVNAIDLPADAALARRIEKFHREIIKDPALSQCLLSPLAVTGKLCSLLITHNSWFINHIVPKLTSAQPLWVDFDIAPALFFNAMRFEMWMDNGFAVPNSAKKSVEIRLLVNNNK